MHDITVLILAKDSEATLERCMQSVSWADSILVVLDPRSADRTEEIARSHTDRVLENEFRNTGNQRNWALPQITTEWTLVLDSDEWVLDELAAKIKSVISDDSSDDGYDVRRQTYFFGKIIKHCGWHHDYNLRLFRTEKGRYDERRVHAKVNIDGTVGRIQESMLHETYQDFSDYMSALDRFSTWGSEDLFERGRKLRKSDLLLRPPIRFLKMYVLRHGFMDGLHGLVLCGLSACAVYLKYAKLWDLERLQRAGEDVSLSRN